VGGEGNLDWLEFVRNAERKTGYGNGADVRIVSRASGEHKPRINIRTLEILSSSRTFLFPQYRLPMTVPSPASDPSIPRVPDIANSQHLIVVSNRLPVTISKDAQGEYHFKMSSGGLVSALSGCKKSMSFTWIGWPGFYINPKDRPIVDKRLMEEYSCQAVYLDDDIADRHYNGFSNSILWPLFHYHPGEMNFDEENWWAYREANLKFAEVVLPHVRTGSMVWVQDYHLMLLPIMLRSLLDGPEKLDQVTFREAERIMDGIVPDDTIKPPDATNVKIGFFLHTPFPSSEIYRYADIYPTILVSGCKTENQKTNTRDP
jgi:trehalose 6-phosphate synthase